jgi:hypothetical protein
MTLTPQQLHDIAGILAQAETVRSAAAHIRQQLAPLQTLVMDAFDMRRETPVLEVTGRSLYLMATDGHCWSVTPDLAQARALVLTQS